LAHLLVLWGRILVLILIFEGSVLVNITVEM
jgi:hypothetical protein